MALQPCTDPPVCNTLHRELMQHECVHDTLCLQTEAGEAKVMGVVSSTKFWIEGVARNAELAHMGMHAVKTPFMRV